MYKCFNTCNIYSLALEMTSNPLLLPCSINTWRCVSGDVGMSCVVGVSGDVGVSGFTHLQCNGLFSSTKKQLLPLISEGRVVH